ncbi:MAG: DUF192 domain-containing protein [Melioribacteraceae bacterium]|nr:DUF192 domain-containing protein [Melioribacteraceae bacterium]MCF8355777.1 DUF192 domain-containing protein [Melioribacteraceae bacterium]MCF8392833.1 DUF192 domain-containing protein [Melioribacteraceae bacterium]MCF8418681.1 DUF192 domain-containing protein [Melioribacteraceae bacterium]
MAKKPKPKSNKHKADNSGKKNIFFAVGAGIIIIVFLFVFILPTNQQNNSSTNSNNTVQGNTAFNFTKQGELTFTNQNDEFVKKIDIELADTFEKRTTGMMYRDKMKENQGMLFVFPVEEPQSFWMKNTVLSLDMIFVNSKREIVKIHKSTTPYSMQSYPSERPATYVVEVIGGFCEKFGIEEGFKINWRLN